MARLADQHQCHTLGDLLKSFRHVCPASVMHSKFVEISPGISLAFACVLDLPILFD